MICSMANSNDFLQLILLSITCGVSAYEIVYSELAGYIKRFFFLDKEQPVLALLSSFKVYKKVLGGYTYGLIPIIVLVIALCLIHKFIYKLLQCPYCLSFWIRGIASLSVSTGLFLLPFLSIFSCAVYNLIRVKAI